MVEQGTKEASLYERVDDKVRCFLCERRCLISEGEKGFCGIRINVGNTLQTLVFGNVPALESISLEINQFYHFWPGSMALTFSSWSCNFQCSWCQNWQLSGIRPQPDRAKFTTPEDLVKTALTTRDQGICASFTEPTLSHEFNCSCFELSRKEGLYNCYVSNGYMTLEALEMLRKCGLDAINLDIKGDPGVYKEHLDGLKAKVIWRNAKKSKELGIHVEMVNLVITDVNDDVNCLNWIIEQHLKNLGPETPLHFTGYLPTYTFNNPATRIETLEKAWKLAKKAGILYPYIGNVPGHTASNTYCPTCGKLLIERGTYGVLRYEITLEKKCPDCNRSIPITGEYIRD